MIVVANWKAYVEKKEDAKKLFALAKKLRRSSGIDTVLCVPAPYIGMLAVGNRTQIGVGAQDLSETTGGAHTGETTGALLYDLGARYVIVGHSERRAAGENDAVVAQKTKRALASGLTPIVCIGETVRDADAKYLKHLRVQIDAVFSLLSPTERTKIILAYEPVWAIGKSAADAITPHDLTEMVLYIRKILADYIPGKTAQRMKVLYGGSAEPENAPLLASGTHIDGFLVGHASADPKMFAELVKSLS